VKGKRGHPIGHALERLTKKLRALIGVTVRNYSSSVARVLEVLILTAVRAGDLSFAR
jgi:hypothetical protein